MRSERRTVGGGHDHDRPLPARRGPRSCSRKLRTSRPRSPTRPSTTTSASVPRAIMPSSVLLPTPLPPNSADALAAAAGEQRVDRAHAGADRHGDRLARQRIQRGRPQRRACGGRQRSQAVDAAGRARRSRGRAARRRPAPSATPPRATMRSPGRMPAVSPSGTDSRRPSRKPTTSRGSRFPWRLRTSQICPTLAAGPVDSTSRPTALVT